MSTDETYARPANGVPAAAEVPAVARLIPSPPSSPVPPPVPVPPSSPVPPSAPLRPGGQRGTTPPAGQDPGTPSPAPGSAPPGPPHAPAPGPVTAPSPVPVSGTPREAPDAAARRAESPAARFAQAWTRAIADTSYTPMSRADVQSHLQSLTERLLAALTAEPFTPTPGYEMGGAMVAAHLFAPETLGRTVQVIDERLLGIAGMETPEARRRLAGLLGVLATGYARALRDRTLDEQEGIRRAALVAREQAEVALRASEARFRHQATHDLLTGLPNRALLTDRLAQIFADRPPGTRVGLCFLDLDGFKAVNDTLGHQFGDLMLVTIAERLDRWLGRDGPTVARMGGDEFAILVEHLSGPDDLTKIADATLGAVAEPIQIGGNELSVTASIGLVECRIGDTDPIELLRRADITLNWAKAGGKGRWAQFDAGRAAEETARYALAAAMPAALDHGQFFLEYQPLVDLATGAVRGVEALVRWRHPELGIVEPDRFIGPAEETGLIVRLGARVLEYACWQAEHWRRRYRDAPFVSVNLAVRQVHDPGLVDRVTGVLDRTGLPPEALQLEITESAVIGHGEHEPLAALRSLADLGVRIAIDDFGTGYSNLAYLRHMPVQELKIAGTFVEGLRGDTADPKDESIMDTLVRLAHTLDLTVTVEGVETAIQADRLRRLGCDAGQGWYLGRPGSPSEVTARLTPR